MTTRTEQLKHLLRERAAAEAKREQAKLPKGSLNLSLLHNGIDFVRNAVILLYSKDPTLPNAHKYAVLSVFSGTLLILKERLRREHRSLVWEEVTNVDQTDKNTVDFDTCLDRLKSIAKVDLDDSQLALLRRARKMRNKIEHSDLGLNLDESEKLVAEMVEFVFIFLRDRLQESLENEMPKGVWREVKHLRQIAKRLSEESVQKSLVGVLTECRQALTKADESTAVALKKIVQHVQEELVRPPAKMVPLNEEQCPRCSSGAVVVLEDEEVAFCTYSGCHAVFESFDLCKHCENDHVFYFDDHTDPDAQCASCFWAEQQERELYADDENPP